tara:strand:+ start:160 stop:507 length:348 start_codon:yes stop_codon:yes gene_type:complete
MKKFILFTFLTLLINICFASFPVSENIRNEIVTSSIDEDPTLFGVNFDNGKIPPLSVFILPWLIPLLLFYLIRGYRKDVKWIRDLIGWINIWRLILAILILFLFGVSQTGSGMGG